MSNRIRVAIVEDETDLRKGLGFFLDGSPQTCCVAQCGTAEEFLEKLPKITCDIVLMNLGLPGISGIEAIPKVKALSPKTQVMMLTVSEAAEGIFQSLAAGATGYLLKSTPPAELIDALTDLHEGGSPMSNSIARQVVETFQQPSSPELSSLSPREREILEELAKGRLYKEIADTLGITTETVRTHVRNIYEKLHVRTRTEAALKILK